MPTETSLAELCSICYVNKPKYKCPRCEAQTCSLPCYKKHQQRAACNGKRDPAAYVKKNQLATPLALDRDFNYFKDVERHVEDAGRNLQERGMSDGHGSLRGIASGWRDESKLQNYLSGNRIILQRAPKGMQRQRENTTRSTKVHRALWTVEWVDDDGGRQLSHDCAESVSISRLFATSKLGKRRKAETSGEVSRAEKKQNVGTAGLSIEGAEPDVNLTARQAHAIPSVTTDSADKNIELDASTVPVGEATSSIPSPPATSHFYLWKPATSSKAKVVTPLDSKATLTDCLAGQIVQEYPTIYVLRHSAAELPTGFVLATEHAKEEITTIKVEPTQQQEPEAQPPVNAQGILAMLRRDLTR
ncbi:hypothetical protein LTR62_000588 [Meristemomyces frigidus]|uniref:HIT-type domain-containing protein n=1 Tax=Meristemomyces frigidus TaxID=1508187 RepID=A0AAN7TKC7_9PEZI|nr:hypothetical protein LTR62_000588 [Meristemomyces frigidus]